MEKFKKVIKGIMDTVELTLPNILFSLVFLLYILIILLRYIFNKGVFQFNELTQVLYIGCGLLAASYAGRSDSHVIFPLLYDKMNHKWKRIFRMISDVVVVAIIIILWKPCWENAVWMMRKKTEVLKIPFFYLYLVFMVFITLTAIYYAYGFIRDLKNPNAEEPKHEDDLDVL